MTGEVGMKFRLALAALAAALAAPALAHHSFAMFDTTREIQLANMTVREWQWTSPHTWLFAIAANGDRYTIEGGNPGLMRRQGFTKGSMAPGMRVTVYMAPLRNGQKGGAINAVILPGGQMLGERKH
jgi:Family of unknown function (DUF6152)